jgi:hypothetical protein
MVITVSNCDNGAAVTISPRVSGNTKQEWYFRAGTQVLESSGCPGKTIDIAAENDSNGAVLHLWAFNPTSVGWNQKWTTSPL